MAADPALARRLARLERLDELLGNWEPPPMDAAAARRLADRVDTALADLDDGPLRDATAPDQRRTAPLPDPTAEATFGGAAGTGGGEGTARGDVVDLGAARTRRRGVPTWAAGAAVAATLTVVVGVGSIVAGGSDDAAQSTVAEDSLADQASTEAELFSDEAAEDEMAAGELEDSADSAGSATMASPRLVGIDLARGELARLVLEDPDDLGSRAAAEARPDAGATGDGNTATSSAQDAPGDDPVARCTTVALERAADGQTVLELVASGTYAGQDAVMVVLRRPGDAQDAFDVAAYSPDDCMLLDRATVRR